MKLAILLLAVFVGSTGLHAQQYQCLKPGVKQYFTNSIHYLRGMRIDSTAIVGTTTVFYPYHTPRIVGNKVDSNGGSWLGTKVLQLADGTTWIDNIRKDTVTIKTQASLGDSWIFYNDTSANYYTAMVVKVDTESVLGLPDSVKTIQITAMKGSTILSSDPFNGYSFALSKDHGFVRIFDLYTFPTILVSLINSDRFLQYGYGTAKYQFSQTEYHNPRYYDLYDFSVGDVYQYSSSLHNPSLSVYEVSTYVRDTIVGKTVTASNISYTVKSYGYSTTYDWNGNKTSASGPHLRVQTSIPNVTLQLLDTLRMPEETGNWFLYYYDPADTSRCTTSALYRREHFYLRQPLDAPANEKTGYKAGFGLTDSTKGYLWGMPEAQAYFHGNMSASIKNGAPCGNFPPPLAVVSTVITGDLFSVYPNPAGNMVNVRYVGPAVKGNKIGVRIMDLAGRSVYHNDRSSGNLSINTGALPEGIYLLRMIVDGKVVNQKLSVVH